MWIARDKDGRLWLCTKKPIKDSIQWIGGGHIFVIQSDALPEVKWEDKEPRELTQLRQLRKAWVGDCVSFKDTFYSIYADRGVLLEVSAFAVARVLSFPTKPMAEDFPSCFKELCETAKILL